MVPWEKLYVPGEAAAAAAGRYAFREEPPQVAAGRSACWQDSQPLRRIFADKNIGLLPRM